MTVRKDDWFPVRAGLLQFGRQKQKELVSYDVTPSEVQVSRAIGEGLPGESWYEI